MELIVHSFVKSSRGPLRIPMKAILKSMKLTKSLLRRLILEEVEKELSVSEIIDDVKEKHPDLRGTVADAQVLGFKFIKRVKSLDESRVAKVNDIRKIINEEIKLLLEDEFDDLLAQIEEAESPPAAHQALRKTYVQFVSDDRYKKFVDFAKKKHPENESAQKNFLDESFKKWLDMKKSNDPDLASQLADVGASEPADLAKILNDPKLVAFVDDLLTKEKEEADKKSAEAAEAEAKKKEAEEQLARDARRLKKLELTKLGKEKRSSIENLKIELKNISSKRKSLRISAGGRYVYVGGGRSQFQDVDKYYRDAQEITEREYKEETKELDDRAELTRGRIAALEEEAAKAEAEAKSIADSRLRHGDLISERWQRLAGLIK